MKFYSGTDSLKTWRKKIKCLNRPVFFVQQNDWLLVEIKQKVQKLHAFEVDEKTKKIENL